MPPLFHSPPRPLPTAFFHHHSLLPRPLTTSTIAMHSSSSTHHPGGEGDEEEEPHLAKKKKHHQQQQQAEVYHQQTKHSLSRYARGPHGLDWSNQPNPFLRFLSSPSLPLPLPPPLLRSSPRYPLLFSSYPPPASLSLPSLSFLLFHSLSLSAWKSTGHSTWSLRVNPSSGNLHPTEAYVLSPALPDSPSPFSSSAFLTHYAPKEHALELRSSLPTNFFPRISPKDGTFLVGLSSIFWREAWKYGERAFRYCNHDVGHAIAAVAVAAATLGWDVKILDGLGVPELCGLLGIAREERDLPSRPVRGRMPWVEHEHPDCVMLVFPAGEDLPEGSLNYAEMAGEIEKLKSLELSGKPNSLSRDHVCWDIIYRTAEAVEKPLVAGESFSVNPFRTSELISESLYTNLTVTEVIRKRRSAVDMDGIHTMERQTFYQILLHCLPSGCLHPGERQGRPMSLPFRVLPWDSEVHCALFVHRVAQLPKGLYFLVRNEDHFDDLRRAMKPEFEWKKPDGCPTGLPLYLLEQGDFRELAKKVSCHQDIASDGCFSLGMVARFEPVLREKGAWMYPRLFWETGVLGQVLYLEAHAVGISATGIGCYFDDAVHHVLGLRDTEFQSLYHFTVGNPVLDRRIMSLPAYPGPQVDA